MTPSPRRATSRARKAPSWASRPAPTCGPPARWRAGLSSRARSWSLCSATPGSAICPRRSSAISPRSRRERATRRGQGDRRASMLISGKERLRYDCQLVLKDVGERGQDKLRKGSVLVVGAGGLGAPVLYYIVAAGVGRVGIVDDDVVELSNRQRHILFTTEDIGRSKAERAAARLRALSPGVQVGPRAAARSALFLPMSSVVNRIWR